MAKIYRVEMAGKTFEEVASSVGELKQVLLARFSDRKRLPRGTVITKVGLTKVKPASKPAPAASSVRVVKAPKPVKPKEGEVLTGPNGKTYTIGQRGRKPAWVQEILDAPSQKGAVAAPVVESALDRDHGHIDTKSGPTDLKWFIAQKRLTLTAVSYAVEESDGKVWTGYVGEECEMDIAKGTKYAIIMDHAGAE
jgi:hypothetical protein